LLKTIRIRQRNAELFHQSNVLHPQFKRILSARNLASVDEIDCRLEQMMPPQSIRNIGSAVDLLQPLLSQGKNILIFGDYDADGATSTALCMRALTLMGFTSVDYLMPDRFSDGYGLSLSVAQRIVKRAPACVITVDNGISSIEGIALLRSTGIEVIVTDHHLPGEQLPDASVILNQNAWADEKVGRNLAGVGVVFYLMLALRSQLRECGWFDRFEHEPNLADCLDLVALGTVADLVPLDFNNRILIKEGLRRIRAGRACPGITALIQISDKEAAHLDCADLAFALAPKINAAGRLQDISIGVKCLLANDPQAIYLASQLDAINRERKQIQQQMDSEAVQIMEQLPMQEIEARSVLVLHRNDWHEGIVGIVAARLRERYHRPSIVFASAEDGQLKGSGRSMHGIHLRDLLDRVDKAQPNLINKFGGHAMAAGLTVDADKLALFDQEINLQLEQIVPKGCFDPVIDCDGELDSDCLQLEFARELLDLSPWGQLFPMPSFIGEFHVLQQRVLSDKHLKLELKPVGANTAAIDAIAFFQDDDILQKDHQVLKIHYELSVNRFRGNESLQLMIKDIL
jgi:single-stranded-DNA-specific exonuclease